MRCSTLDGRGSDRPEVDRRAVERFSLKVDFCPAPRAEKLSVRDTDCPLALLVKEPHAARTGSRGSGVPARPDMSKSFGVQGFRTIRYRKTVRQAHPDGRTRVQFYGRARGFTSNGDGSAGEPQTAVSVPRAGAENLARSPTLRERYNRHFRKRRCRTAGERKIAPGKGSGVVRFKGMRVKDR